MISFRSLPVLCALALALSVHASVAQADQIDSPLYKAWSTYKPGTTKTLASTFTVNGMEIKSEVTATLKEVTDDHVTVDIVSSSSVNGHSHDSPPHTQTYAAKLDDQGIKQTGEESVDAMGKTFKCKVYTIGSDAVGAAVNVHGDVKVWICDDVPGGTVKMVATSQRPGVADTTVTYILTNYEAK